MPYETGGRANIYGSNYEDNIVISKIIEIIEEKILSIRLQPIGDFMDAVDITVRHTNGSLEYAQCKGRNGSKEYWTFGDINSYGLWEEWKNHLERDNRCSVSLITPLPFTLLEDLVKRSKNSDSPQGFLDDQVNKSPKVEELYKKIVNVWKLNSKKIDSVSRSVDYLSRIHIKQSPDYNMTGMNCTQLSRLLYSECDIFSHILKWIKTEDVLGKEINLSIIEMFFREENIRFKNLAYDERVKPNIDRLNKDFTDSFIPLDYGIIPRSQVDNCIEHISNGKSILIDGNAGRGKSGVVHAIVQQLFNKNVPFIAISLDKNIPRHNIDGWSSTIGFPEKISLVQALHSVSASQNAVILLDQLDVLRWTQAHTYDALKVCKELINTVEAINVERQHKISVVFVCRSYDLTNDNGIKQLFSQTDNQTEVKWFKVNVGELNEAEIRAVVGNRFDGLNSSLKKVLGIVSNLYIWEHIEDKTVLNNCSTTNQLIAAWWIQLCHKCGCTGISDANLKKEIEAFVIQLEGAKSNSVLSRVAKMSINCIEYLSSEGFIIEANNKLSFAHQSILDYFVSLSMYDKFCQAEELINIIGNYNRQNIHRRYSFQMFLQTIQEDDCSTFVNLGKKILFSDNIRYSYKFVFFEILNQLGSLDNSVKEFLLAHYEDEIFGHAIVNNVISVNPVFIRMFRDEGILDNWITDSIKKHIVFKCLRNFRGDFNSEDVAFLRRYIFSMPEDVRSLDVFFIGEIEDEIDDFFELRIDFYEHYPNRFPSFHTEQLVRIFNAFPLRLAKLMCVSFDLDNKFIGPYLDKFEEKIQEAQCPDLKLCIQCVKLLLPKVEAYCEDPNYSLLKYGILSRYPVEKLQTIIVILKKLNEAIAKEAQDECLSLYEKYLGSENPIMNELILTSFLCFDKEKSDFIINYLSASIEGNATTIKILHSGGLELAKKVISIHSRTCSAHAFEKLEHSIYYFIPKNAAKVLKHRRDYNLELKEQRKHGVQQQCDRVYWTYWGDLQLELIPCLPINRASLKTIYLLKELNRKFGDSKSVYCNLNYNSHIANVIYPIAEKSLTDNNWSQILSSKKITNNDNRIKMKGGSYIASDIHTFRSKFSNEVRNNPIRMIKIVLSKKDDIREGFIEELFCCINYSEALHKIPLELIEGLFLTFSVSPNSVYAKNMCGIIKKRPSESWSNEIIEFVIDTATEFNELDATWHRDHDGVIDSNDLYAWHLEGINTTRGEAVNAINELLGHNNCLFKRFKPVLETLCSDVNRVVRLMTVNAIWQAHSIDCSWTMERLVVLLEADIRMGACCSYPVAIFINLYKVYPEIAKNIIKRMFSYDNKDVVKRAAIIITKLFFEDNQFVDILLKSDTISQLQAKKILRSTYCYFGDDNHNQTSKTIILHILANHEDLAETIETLMFDDAIIIERDLEFIKDVFSYDISYPLIYSFVNYVSKSDISLMKISELIFQLSDGCINDRISNPMDRDNIKNRIAELVLGLYDETSSNNDYSDIAIKCLDVWDALLESEVGSSLRLNAQLLRR